MNDFELASRLSYFLWSSAPDEELMTLAAAGELTNPDVIAAQTQRMLKDKRVRRLAIEFGSQWLHVRDFGDFDEKSERHFPEFAAVRNALGEEPVRFFTDLFQHDGAVLDLLNADHTFVNGTLAKYYAIGGSDDAGWRRVEGVRAKGAVGSWDSVRRSPNRAVLRGPVQSCAVHGSARPCLVNDCRGRRKGFLCLVMHLRKDSPSAL